MKRRATVAVLALLLGPGMVRADFTWDGGGPDDFFSTNANWDPDGAPPSNLAGQSLIFGDTMGVGSLTPDLNGDTFTTIDGLSFTNADGSYTIMDSAGGGTLSFFTGASITNDSGFLQTIDVQLAAIGQLTFDLMDDMVVSGVIGGPLTTIKKTGAGTLTLSGSNTYFGGTELEAGTIILGNDSALGSSALLVTGDSSLESDNNGRVIGNRVDIADMVTLTLQGAFDLRLNGQITGDGRLTIDMAAATNRITLAGANIFTGDTVLNRGTLVLANNFALGTGDLILGNDSTLEAIGSVIIGNDVAAASHQLTFGGDGNLTLNGVIFGGADLVIDMNSDSARVTLSESNSVNSATLTQGTLVFGNDNAIGSATLMLAGNGTIESNAVDRVIANAIDLGAFQLTFGGSSALQLDGIISGTGGLTVDATSRLTLTTANTYTGDTNIDSGTLILDGGSVNGSVNLNAGILRGDDTGSGSIVGSLRAFGGTVSPGLIAGGDPIGTLTIGGIYDQMDGSTLRIDIDTDTGRTDLLDVTGPVQLGDLSTVDVSFMGTSYIQSNSTFTIIDSVGGITNVGAGADLTTNFQSVTITFTSNITTDAFGDHFNIVLVRAADAYSQNSGPGNNRAIGLSLDSLIPIADSLTPSVNRALAQDVLGRLDVLDAAGFVAAVRQLSPEPYNSNIGTGVTNARAFTLQQAEYLAGYRTGLELPTMPGPPAGAMALANDDPLILATAIAQARAAEEGPPAEPQKTEDTPWGRYFKVQGVFSDQDTTGNRTGFNANTFGIQAGADYAFSPSLVAGVALGYAFTTANLDLGVGEIGEHTVRVGPYMTYYKDNWYVDASATAAYHRYSSDRNIPALGLTASGDYNGFDFTGYAGTGYHYRIARDTYLTPVASILYSYFYFDSFTESGGGGGNLTVSDRDANSLQSRVGANLSYRIPNLKWQPIPYFYGGWQHEFFDDEDIEASFAAGGTPFNINTGVRDKNAIFLGGGVNILIDRNMAAFLRIESVLGNTSTAAGFSLGISVGF